VIAALFIAVAIPSIAASVSTIHTILGGGVAVDWMDFVHAAEHVQSGTPYGFAYPHTFRWSPVAALAFGLIVPMGLFAWRALHLAALLADAAGVADAQRRFGHRAQPRRSQMTAWSSV